MLFLSVIRVCVTCIIGINLVAWYSNLCASILKVLIKNYFWLCKEKEVLFSVLINIKPNLLF